MDKPVHNSRACERRRITPVRFASVFASVIGACVIRLTLHVLLRDNGPYLTFFPVVVAWAWFAGSNAGLLATFLSALITVIFVLPFGDSHNVSQFATMWSLIVFIATGVAVSVLGEKQLKANEDARAAEEGARGSEARKTAILNAALDCIIVTDSEGVVTEANPHTELVFGGDAQRLVGQRLTESIFPLTARESYDRAMSDFRETGDASWLGQRVDTVAIRNDGTEFPIEFALMPAAGGPRDGFIAYIRDISERKAQEEALRASEEHLRLAMEGARIGTWQWDVGANQLKWSQTMGALLGFSDPRPGGYSDFLDAVHPDDREVVKEAVATALRTNEDYDIEFRVIWPNGEVHWHSARGHAYAGDDGRPVRMEGIAIDITARKEAEEEAMRRANRGLALSRVSHATREAVAPDEMHTIALTALGETLKAQRCLSLVIDTERETVEVVADWHADGLVDFRGTYPLGPLSVDLQETFGQGGTMVVEDTARLQFTAGTQWALERAGIRSLINVPFEYKGKVIAIVGVYMVHESRVWTSEEVAFVEAVASQLRASSESARNMAELRARAEREQLLNRIGEAMRATLDPDEIQTRTASLLAEALGADRCYVATYELERGVVSVRTDWHRPGLESIKGDHAFSNTKRMFDELYRGSPTSIVINRDEAELSEQTKSNMQGIGIFSRVSVAFADPRSGHMATLTAAMSHSERRWTDEEVELVQKTATLLRSAVETARVSEREHNIATQLQEALLPKIPEDIPSLTIKSLMAPALDEAAVGGDFCDVFALTGSKYAIVIGDVSGKGLAAAAQLATVRNSLRATLYLYRSPMAAVASVNAILTANQLLVGFVTAFVGLYDTLSGELVYTTCGHEPGLLLRADKGTVEWLSTPGLPLGVTDDEPFAQATVNVAHGDTLVLYTDGISEAGHDRRDLLGLDRLACIVEGLPSDLSAEAAANQIVHSAREHARGTFRDDVCVLVARRI